MAKMENRNNNIVNFDFHIEDLVGEEFSRGSILVDSDMNLHVRVNKGVLPKIDEIFLILLGHKDGYRAIARAMGFKRKYPYRVDVREGFSGCRDYKLVSAIPVATGIYKKEVKAKLHVSMENKLNDVDIVEGVFLPDFLAFFMVHDDFTMKTIEKIIHASNGYGFRANIRFMRNLQRKCYGRAFGYNRPSLVPEALLEKEGFVYD